MLIIGIAGGTGSGKTTVARSVIDRLGSDKVTFISQDNYYKNLTHLNMNERELINYDHPFAFDTELTLMCVYSAGCSGILRNAAEPFNPCTTNT